VIDFRNNLITFQDWVEEVQKQHQKYLYLLSQFQGEGKCPKPTKLQWQQALKRDPNAMDTSVGHTRAQAALTEDK
jgi:hypothetical protein